MILGFTGPRGGPTAIQKVWLGGYFGMNGYKSTLHHGACVGSDEAAHWAALDAEVPLIVVHPPVNTKWMMNLDNPSDDYYMGSTHVIVLPPKPYHDRDKDIVNACERLISTPAGEPTPRSGTWFTINYALSQHKPITLCYPDGEVDEL